MGHLRLAKDALTTGTAITIAVAVVLLLFQYGPEDLAARARMYGFILLCLGLIPLGLAKLRRIKVKQIAADMVFGALDTSLMVAFAILFGLFGGPIGIVVGAGLGDALAEAIAAFFEGSIAEKLRAYGIDESRTALRTSLGKMAGCLFGAGACILLAPPIVAGLLPVLKA